MTIRVEFLRGPSLRDAISALAELRIAVFRHFPYLYDGDAAYEVGYLADFAASPSSVLVGAFDGERLIGAATASPLALQAAQFQGQVRDAGLDPDELFYFGESVLLPEFRGRGLGHAFFDARERSAQEQGAKGAIFASVIRPADHPERPAGYRALDPFWRKRGYAPIEGLVMEMAWQEIGEAGESSKRLQCWIRRC